MTDRKLSARLAAALGAPGSSPDDFAPTRTKVTTQILSPTPPSPFLCDEAEVEIRRNVNRHYQQINEIEQLKTDGECWRHRAELAESENDRLRAELKERDAQVDELKRGIATLHTQFHSGAQMWITGYRTLVDLNQYHPMAPTIENDIKNMMPALEQITPESANGSAR